MAFLDKQPPDTSRMETHPGLNELRNYVDLLRRELAFWMRNLDEGNLNLDEPYLTDNSDTIKNIVSTSEEIEEQLETLGDEYDKFTEMTTLWEVDGRNLLQITGDAQGYATEYNHLTARSFGAFRKLMNVSSATSDIGAVYGECDFIFQWCSNVPLAKKSECQIDSYYSSAQSGKHLLKLYFIPSIASERYDYNSIEAGAMTNELYADSELVYSEKINGGYRNIAYYKAASMYGGDFSSVFKGLEVAVLTHYKSSSMVSEPIELWNIKASAVRRLSYPITTLNENMYLPDYSEAPEDEWRRMEELAYTHPTSGVTADVYNSVAVDEYGHVVSGYNPTTLSGYGITDAVSKNELSSHNTSSTAHTDIKELISQLSERLNALADSEDIDLDQLSEIVAYIKANRELIDSITTSKVSVSDIVDNLDSTSTNKPLSANQGRLLGSMINELSEKADNAKDDMDNKLKSYLPLSGGIMTGDIKWSTGANGVSYSLNTGKISFGLPNRTDGYANYIFDAKNTATDTRVGGLGVFGTKGNLDYYFFGANYASPSVKITPSGEVTATKFVGDLSGTATVATKLSNVTAIGSATQPVYFRDDGVPVATTYTLGASVPSGAVFTDENVSIEAAAPSTATTYYPVWHTTTSGTSTKLKANDGFMYRTLQGTTSANGFSVMVVGNGKATGSSGNKYGVVRIYGKNTYYTDIAASDTLSANRTLTLPNGSGRLALASEISDTKVTNNLATTTKAYVTGTTTASTNTGTQVFDTGVYLGTTAGRFYADENIVAGADPSASGHKGFWIGDRDGGIRTAITMDKDTYKYIVAGGGALDDGTVASLQIGAATMGDVTANGTWTFPEKIKAGNIITGTKTLTMSSASAYGYITLSYSDLGFYPSTNTSVVATVRLASTPTPRYLNVYAHYWQASSSDASSKQLCIFVSNGAAASTTLPAGTYYVDYIVTNNA